MQDAQPVAVAQHLVFGVHGGHRVFQIENGRKRGFQHQVAHTGGIGFADGGAAVDADIEMQAVVLQQHGRRVRRVALVAGELCRVLEAGAGTALHCNDKCAAFDAVSRGIGMRALGQRGRFIEHTAGEGNDLGAALFVVAGALFTAIGLRNRVGSIERVVQAAPAGIGGIERVAGIQDGHHKLRAGLEREFVVDVGGGGLHVGRLGHEVADALKKGAVGEHVLNRTWVGLVPSVQLSLQALALGQQGDVARGQVGDDGIKPPPESSAFDAGTGKHLFIDEALEDGGYLQAVEGGAIGHRGLGKNRKMAGRPGGRISGEGRPLPLAETLFEIN